MIPPECQDTFRAAETVQYEEHLKYNALAPLSVEESRAVRKDKPERVLRCRFAYRDKHWSKRKAQPDLGWKPKSRLVIGGHCEPDLHRGLPTHAPAVSRQAPYLLLQVLASNLDQGCTGSAGDITATFLNGPFMFVTLGLGSQIPFLKAIFLGLGPQT